MRRRGARPAGLPAEHVAFVLERTEEEIAKLRSNLPDALKLKEAELSAEQRRLSNFVDFIGQGRGSQALAKGARRNREASRRSQRRRRRAPPQPGEGLQASTDRMVKDRLEHLQDVLEEHLERSAHVLRQMLGPIRLELTTPDIGRPSSALSRRSTR
jgi:hypothetical protein